MEGGGDIEEGEEERVRKGEIGKRSKGEADGWIEGFGYGREGVRHCGGGRGRVRKK